MKIERINYTNNRTFTQDQKNVAEQKPKSFLDKFTSSARNLSDMNDTIVVPRTIFKGYLEFMVGTAFMTAGNLIKKPANLGKGLLLVGSAIATYGAFSFVRPYVIKDAPGVMQKK